MNNCDLEKLSVPGIKLEPPFRPDITSYKATVHSQITKINIDVLPSDTGASYSLIGHDSTREITLKDGLNTFVVEVTAEDGTVKKYILQVNKLSASNALLHRIKLSDNLHLAPSFVSEVYEYSCTVPYFQSTVNIQPTVLDSRMKVKVNGKVDIKSVDVAVGDTQVVVQATSADGTKSQVYLIVITRMVLPFCVQFANVQDQMKYECPVSLTALYRPISINGSDPKHIFSAPYLDLLTRRSKTDPLDETPLKENWRIPEYEFDMSMSVTDVYCCYAHRGCNSILKLSEFGHHVLNCSFMPRSELDVKTVTETEWYKNEYSTDKNINFGHVVKERSWEKNLQQVSTDNKMDKLCTDAEEQIRLYKERLPKPGDVLEYKEGMSPLGALHQASIDYASAIKLKPKDPNLHFHLGMVLEEYYYAAEIYGLKKKKEDEGPDFNSAKATGKNEEILAICKLHGVSGQPSTEQQLKALDLEYHQLKEQGQSSRADYIQNLFAWKSKQAGKMGVISLDEENPLTQAFLKYQDALSLNPENWQYSFHVGRLLLQQKMNKEALTFLQKALALRPESPITRCYTGLAIAEQDDGPGTQIQECVLYLHQGLESLLCELLITPESQNVLKANNLLCLLNVQLLRGFLRLAKLLKNISTDSSCHFMTFQKVLHLVVDWSVNALCQCPHKGNISKELEWILLEATYSLLESLVQESSDNEDWIRKRCQALSALIRLTSIPVCKELLDMQEKVCQLGVIASPCNSYSLYLLGMAQLAQYDNNPSSEKAILVLQEANLSFTASINLENLPVKGSSPTELTKQKWWQEWKAAEEEKKQKKANKDKETAKITTSPSVNVSRTACARGTAPLSRGAAKTIPNAKKTIAATARGVNNKAVSTNVARGRGTTGLSTSKNIMTLKPKAPSTPVKATEPQLSSIQNPTESETSCAPVQDFTSRPVPLNQCSYLHRLGLARALSRTKETAAEASSLYQEVIKMAPEVHDAYIELADLLLNTDPLAAVDIYCQYPQNSAKEQSFEDAFIPGEIVRLLIKCEKYDDPRLPINMISYGKVMGIGCLEKYITILEEKFKTSILKSVYAGIHSKSVDDEDLQNFFRFKCWI